MPRIIGATGIFARLQTRPATPKTIATSTSNMLLRALYAPMSENASTAGTITFLSILSTLAKNFTPPRPMMTMKTTLSTSPSIMV